MNVPERWDEHELRLLLVQEFAGDFQYLRRHGHGSVSIAELMDRITHMRNRVCQFARLKVIDRHTHYWLHQAIKMHEDAIIVWWGDFIRKMWVGYPKKRLEF